MNRSSFYMLRQLFLPILGAVLLLGTLIWGAILGGFQAWLLGMGGAALVLLVLGIVWQERGSVRDSVASIAYSLFIFLSCIFVYLMVANHSVPIDVTEHRVHTLSEQTRVFLHQLDTQVQVTVFAELADHASLRDFLDLYERESDKIHFEIFDPTINAAEAMQFADSVYPGDVFVTAYRGGEQLRRQRTVIRATDRYRENSLSNALLRVVRGRDQKIYFLSDKGERGLTPLKDRRPGQNDFSLQKAAQQMSDSIMPVAGLDLQTAAQIPTDAGVVVISGPTIDLYDREREILLSYLDEGGSILILIDPMLIQGRDFPNLRAVMQRAGIDAPNEILIDRFAPRDVMQGLPVMVRPVGEHAIVAASSDKPFLMNNVRPLENRPELASADAMITPLLASHDKVWAEDPQELRDTLKATPPEDEALIHAWPTAMASIFGTPGGVRGDVARMVVIGDSDTFGNDFVQDESATFLTQCVNWLAAREDQMAIPPKLLPATHLELTEKRFWIICGGLLLLGLGLLAGGVGYTIARRRMR
ncbi:GldG family protein [bacterium]|nr:GldG family protein [bacterium]